MRHVTLWFDPERNHDAFAEGLDLFAPVGVIDVEMPPEQGSAGIIKEVNHELQVLKLALQHPVKLQEETQARVREILLRPRSEAFRTSVKRAYLESCAICGSNLRGPDGKAEVEAAHVYPRALNGREDVRNGLCLCRRHHWALDVGWLAISDDLRVVVRSGLPEHEDYEFIRSHAGEPLRQPVDERVRLHPLYTKNARLARGGFDE